MLNGFGKSTGLVQVEELGTIETPILLTNTLSVGTCCTALVRHAIERNPDIGRETATVNPVVFECNDGFLSDIQALAVTEDDARAAARDAASQFDIGSVGAGMRHERIRLQGRNRHILAADWISTAELSSRRARPCKFRPSRRPSASRRQVVAPPAVEDEQTMEKGSIIIVMATDVPLSDRQIKRVISRSGVGLARLGSFWGHGSGDIALGFTTAQHRSRTTRSGFGRHQKIFNETSHRPSLRGHGGRYAGSRSRCARCGGIHDRPRRSLTAPDSRSMLCNPNPMDV